MNILQKQISTPLILSAVLACGPAPGQVQQKLVDAPWPNQPPAECPFTPSQTLKGIAFTGRHAEYAAADTWYPSWASDGNMYSPWTDGNVLGLVSNSAGANATTGYATILGDDPLNLQVVNQAVYPSDPSPFQSRYPCGSLVYNGVWYYGTYCLGGGQVVMNNGITYNWPWLRLTWNEEQTVDRVWLFDRPNTYDQITGGLLVFSDGSTVSVGALPDDATQGVEVCFPARRVQWMDFRVTAVKPGWYNIGLSEIAVFRLMPPTISVSLEQSSGESSYTRRDPAVGTPLTYTVWTSTDLVTWTEDTAATQTVTGTAGEVQTVKVRLGGTIPLAPPKLFVQIRAN